MKNLIIGLLGANDPHDFLHAFIWALVGAVISLLMHTNNRDPLSKSSPVEFSWRFMFLDNLKRIVLTLLLIIVFLRFMPDLLGTQLSGIAAFLVGFGWDKLAQLLKDKGWLGSK